MMDKRLTKDSDALEVKVMSNKAGKEDKTKTKKMNSMNRQVGSILEDAERQSGPLGYLSGPASQSKAGSPMKVAKNINKERRGKKRK
jgi:hypothetical protein